MLDFLTRYSVAQRTTGLPDPGNVDYFGHVISEFPGYASGQHAMATPMERYD